MSDNKKLEAIMECLKENVMMPTKTIVKKVLIDFDLDVSERYVQKVRKAERELQDDAFCTKIGDIEKEGDENMWQTDNGMEDWQVEVLNMANEGGYSVNQITAEFMGCSDNDIRKTLTDFHFMLSEPVLDEDSDNVYFRPDTSDKVIHLPHTPATPEVNKSATKEDYWEVALPECITACSKAEKEVQVFMSKTARQKAMMFMQWAKAREWLAYLIGEKKDDGYYIHDLYLPDQRTSATLVDKVVADNYNTLTIVGVIHSHHEMGAGDADNPSFSGHDAEFINSNHNLSLLAGRDRDTKGFKLVGVARVTTPCGGLMTVKATVKPMKEEVSDEEKALKEDFFGKVFGHDPSKINGKDISNNKTGNYNFANGGRNWSGGDVHPIKNENAG